MTRKEKIDSFNDWLADRLSGILSLMFTFYIVTLLVVVPLFYGAPTTVVSWAQYLCSVVFQGIALPVLGYTAKKAGDKADRILTEVLNLTRDMDKVIKHVEELENKIEEDVSCILVKIE